MISIKHFRFSSLKGSSLHSYAGRFLIVVVVAAAALFISVPPAETQGFSSGSNGSDGALNLTTPGVVLFDPKSFTPPFDADGDNIFHFTTINIATGVTVKLSGRIFTGPVFWLATGPVTIDGTIDLNGETGHPRTVLSSVRAPSVPGAGGYSGGVGGDISSPNFPTQPGNGPGGGAPDAGGGSFTGNVFLVPLVGGSGGGGESATGQFGAGGSAGGGALLIASSDSISVKGIISANGGGNTLNGSFGGGSGGAIRLMAPTIRGTGIVIAQGGQTVRGGSFNGKPGRVRLEAFNHQETFNINATFLSQASPFNVFLPNQPSVRVVSVAGVPVNQMPTGSFQIPDVLFNSNSPVTVAIEAHNIPLGTVVKLHLFSENGPDQFVDSTPLAGTIQSSAATASVVLPSGFTRGFVRATWTE